MASAKQLPSGNWRVRIFDGYDSTGKSKYQSFTAETPEEAEYLAAEYKFKRKREDKPSNMTVGQAIDRYIESKDAVLSPTTIKAYKSIRNNLAQEIMMIKLDKISNELIQRSINKDSKTHSPKTMRNLHGLISSALKQYYPSLQLTTTLPRKEKHDVYLPVQEDIKRIVDITTDTPMELPVLLAICLGLRRSEICGLTWENTDLTKRTIKITQAKVSDDNNEWVIKSPKSYAGNRVLIIPNVLYTALNKQEEKSGFIVTITPGTITNSFKKITTKLNIPHFRFHDLRHYNASIMLALGIPDKYAMERMGHSSNNMLKNVYQHTLDSEKEKINDIIDDYLSDIFIKK